MGKGGPYVVVCEEGGKFTAYRLGIECLGQQETLDAAQRLCEHRAVELLTAEL